MRMLEKKAVVDKRIELVRLLDGDVFYSMRIWPRSIERTFWRKPIRDVEVFKLLLFLLATVVRLLSYPSGYCCHNIGASREKNV